ncbi:LysR family transcriptional regulator [Pseudomaricurvus alkylphenolicus]|uniref:hydrogen peroxide-inducible genes activator n=1 Tax=Pseudomaricurvus alkylphenolicus TaxID=1306991 RepID=UPI00141FC553|nr:hydrogen peroxide-inducible genes activator [Pseudomaricurvus alkylphenolicus]NIB40784.1 LysR family transcriptional regulator [Pseudomaricurvus alkylphenolicus]
MISLKQLTYALAVEKTLHFKKAAEACAVSQSALSTALSELEKQLGFQIFERDNKKVLVTPLGKKLLEKALKIRLDIDDLYQMANANKEPLSYPLSIGVIPTIGPYLLPRVLPSLNREYPKLELTLVEEQSHVLVDMVRKGELDTAILALPFDCDGLLTFEFWHEDFYWVTDIDDPLGRRQQISNDEIQQRKLMLLKDGHCLKDHTLSACQLSDQSSSITFNSTSLTTLIQMVAGKMGSTLVPQMALDQLLGVDIPIQAVHLDEPGPHRRVAFVTRPNFVDVKSIELLMALFRSALAT